MTDVDVAIIGAGAAGMMCALEARKRGRSVVLLDHAQKIGEKIRISGGGHCNFTNMDVRAERYLSQNPHFCKSALKRFTPHDFLVLVERHRIDWFEKDKGALFCRDDAAQIIDMLLDELAAYELYPRTRIEIEEIEQGDDGFVLDLGDEILNCASLVVATGGKSIPAIGATGIGLQIAEHFELDIIEPRPALVPLTFDQSFKHEMKELVGNSLEVRVSTGGQSFTDAMLFTHRGLSGPAILQISSFWREGEELVINLTPGLDLLAALRKARQSQGKSAIQTVLGAHIPKKLAVHFCEKAGLAGNMADHSDKRLTALCELVTNWVIRPVGTEGYRTAEVMLGGVDTNELSSKTMQAKEVEGLYFIGEVVDVTGWLGGYNFQWAWSSGWCAGQFV